MAVAKSVQEKLENDRTMLEAKLRALAEADAMTEVYPNQAHNNRIIHSLL